MAQQCVTMSTSAKLLKCARCNIVICEVLAFIQNKLDVMDTESLIRVCLSGFTGEDIENAKQLLYESMPTRKKKVSRRKDGKPQRELEDIICLFRDTDPEVTPIFVAKELQKLPPICFDHIDATRLLKDLLILKTEVAQIKETYLIKEDFSKMLKNEQLKLDSIDSSNRGDYVNCRRGAGVSESCCVDSGPFGLPHIILNKATVDESTEECMDANNVLLNASDRIQSISVTPTKCIVSKTSNEEVRVAGALMKEPVLDVECSGSNISLLERSMAAECTANYFKGKQGQVQQQAITLHHGTNINMHPASTPRACNRRPTAVSNKPVGPGSKVQSSTQAHKDVPLAPMLHSLGGDLALMRHVERPTAVSAVTFADALKSRVEPKEGDWIKVTNKNRNRFIGNRGKGFTDSKRSFKAAESKIPFYIYNVDKGALINDIKNHIFEKTNVTVDLVKIKMKQPKDYEAYRFDIPQHKLSLFMDENMWPAGISFRRYIYFKSRSTDAAQTNRTDANKSLVNG